MERLKIYPVLLFLNVFKYKQLDERILFSTDFEDIKKKKKFKLKKKKEIECSTHLQSTSLLDEDWLDYVQVPKTDCDSNVCVCMCAIWRIYELNWNR